MSTPGLLVVLASTREEWRRAVRSFVEAAGHEACTADTKIELLHVLARTLARVRLLIVCDTASAEGKEMAAVLVRMKRASEWDAPLVLEPGDQDDAELAQWRALPHTVVLEHGLDLGSVLARFAA